MPHDAASLDALLILLGRSPTTLAEFRQKYAARAAVAAAGPVAMVDAAAVYRELLADVVAVEQAWSNQLVTYEEAERQSGLSQKQLSRLAKSGAVESEGTNRNRRFRRGDLPTKRGYKPPPPPPPPVAPSSAAPYDPGADARRLARQLASQRRGN